MNNKFTEYSENLSVFSFLVLSIVLTFQKFSNGAAITSCFWIFFLVFMASVQYFGLKFKEDLRFVRLCMAWASGVIWTWLSFSTLNTTLAVLAMVVGGANIYTFVLLINQINFDWQNFTRKQ